MFLPLPRSDFPLDSNFVALGKKLHVKSLLLLVVCVCVWCVCRVRCGERETRGFEACSGESQNPGVDEQPRERETAGRGASRVFICTSKNTSDPAHSLRSLSGLLFLSLGTIIGCASKSLPCSVCAGGGGAPLVLGIVFGPVDEAKRGLLLARR